MSKARFLNNIKFTKIKQELESYLKLKLKLVRKQVLCENMEGGWRNKDEEKEMRKIMKERVAWYIEAEIEKVLRRNLLDWYNSRQLDS